MLSGKGMFIWMIRHTMDGNVNAIADTLAAAGITNAWIKVADGSGRYNIDPLGVDRVPGLVAALRMRGISVWGWQYIYGRYPDSEADMAIRRIREFDLDGFVVNAELEFKAAGMKTIARRYMQRLRNAYPDLPIGISSYRFPTFHSPFPFNDFLEYCDFAAPQVYWAGATNAGAQLVRCMNEYKNLAVKRPIYPTGAAYQEHGWKATANQMIDFMQTAKDQKLAGFNFWEMRACQLYIAGGWQAVHDFKMTEDGGPGTGEGPGEEPETGKCRAQVVADEVTLRTGPGVNYPEDRKLKNGETVDVLDIVGSSAWLLVSRNPDRYIAAYYANKRYVRLLHD